jgi:hypothetical protein
MFLGSGIRDPRSGIRDPGSGIRDPGSGVRKKPIPDPGSRGQKAPNPGSRIPDPDPQHWAGVYLSEASLPS